MGNAGGSDENFQWGPQEGIRKVQGLNALSIDTRLSNARPNPTTPATTPPGNPIQSMQQYQQMHSTPRPLHEGRDPFRQVHGMDDIRQIVLNHLLANQSPNEPANPSGGEPKQKKARLEYPPLQSSRDTKESLDTSVFKAKAKFHVHL